MGCDTLPVSAGTHMEVRPHHSLGSRRHRDWAGLTAALTSEPLPRPPACTYGEASPSPPALVSAPECLLLLSPSRRPHAEPADRRLHVCSAVR